MLNIQRVIQEKQGVAANCNLGCTKDNQYGPQLYDVSNKAPISWHLANNLAEGWVSQARWPCNYINVNYYTDQSTHEYLVP